MVPFLAHLVPLCLTWYLRQRRDRCSSDNPTNVLKAKMATNWAIMKANDNLHVNVEM